MLACAKNLALYTGCVAWGNDFVGFAVTLVIHPKKSGAAYVALIFSVVFKIMHIVSNCFLSNSLTIGESTTNQSIELRRCVSWRPY